MATLLDYTHTEFPNHTLEVWHPDGWTMPVRPDHGDPDHGDPDHRDPTDRRDREVGPPGQAASRRPPAAPPADGGDLVGLPLAEHTVVAHVIGADATISLLERMRAAGWTRTAAVLVCPAEPSVVPQGDEDRESVTDLPDRRPPAGPWGWSPPSPRTSAERSKPSAPWSAPIPTISDW